MSEFRPDDCYLSATELAERIRQQKVSPVEVIDALTKRIAKLNPRLNAYITLDLENARKDAVMKWEILKQHPKGDLGPLYGVPVAIKDDIPVAGMRYTFGSRLCTYEPKSDDVTVARLKKAGAIVLGKTHLPECGHKGVTDNLLGPGGKKVTTVNPYDESRTTGGSSGGSAAAVAAGLAYLALGSDIAGSIRIPAAFCGLVGLKASFGMIPRYPSGNAFTLWVTGPLARSAADVLLAMRVLAGPDERDRFSFPIDPSREFNPAALREELPPLTIAWHPSPADGPVDPHVARTCRDALDLLIKGHRRFRLIELARPMLKHDQASELLGVLKQLFRVGSLSDFRALTSVKDRATFRKKKEEITPTLYDFVAPAWDVTLDQYLEAQAALTTLVEENAAAFFADFDVLATPTTAVPAFDRHLDLGPDRVQGRVVDPLIGWAHTWPFNLTGHPAVSVNAGWSKDDKPLPIGLQLVGKRGQDALVLRLAAAVEAIVAPAQRRPPL